VYDVDREVVIVAVPGLMLPNQPRLFQICVGQSSVFVLLGSGRSLPAGWGVAQLKTAGLFQNSGGATIANIRSQVPLEIDAGHADKTAPRSPIRDSLLYFDAVLASRACTDTW